METHYVCSECATVSKLPGNCQNDACIRQGTRLVECHCDDGNHDPVLGGRGDEFTEDAEKLKEEARKYGYSTTMLDLDAEQNLADDVG